MTTLTLVHVAISLIGILTGLIAVCGLIGSKGMDGLHALFLASTVATSATGFLFPFHRFMPSHAIGIFSLLILAIAIVARYSKKMAGGWRKTYVITAVFALYLNTFVLVAQVFMKVPALHAMAPHGNEPPFLIVQLVVLALFFVLGIMATFKFRLEPAQS